MRLLVNNLISHIRSLIAQLQTTRTAAWPDVPVRKAIDFKSDE